MSAAGPTQKIVMEKDEDMRKARAEMAARSEENAKAAAAQADAAPPAAEQGPRVALEVIIRVLEDGNVHVTAPFEQQLLVRGALSAAEDVVRMMGGQLAAQRREQGVQVVRKGEPWYRKFTGRRG